MQTESSSQSPQSIRDRFRSVSTSTNSLPNSPIPPSSILSTARSTCVAPPTSASPLSVSSSSSSLSSSAFRSGGALSNDGSARSIEPCQTPPPKLPPRSQPTPPKQIMHSPNCRLNLNAQSNSPVNARFASLSVASGASSPVSVTPNHALSTPSNGTIHNRIAISFASNSSSGACTSVVRNDVRRTPNATRRTLQLTTTSVPASFNSCGPTAAATTTTITHHHPSITQSGAIGLHGQRSSSVSDQTFEPNQSNGSSTFISVRSTVAAQMPAKRISTSASPQQQHMIHTHHHHNHHPHSTSSNTSHRLSSLPSTPSSQSQFGQPRHMDSGNIHDSSTSSYRNPNFARGKFLSCNFGHNHPSRTPDYSLIKHEPAIAIHALNRKAIHGSGSSSASVNGTMSLRTHRPEVYTGPAGTTVNSATRSIQNGGQAFNFLTSSISSPSLNSDSDDEEPVTGNPSNSLLGTSAVPNRKDVGGVFRNGLRPQPLVLPKSEDTRNLSSLASVHGAMEVSPLRRSHTLMLNSSGKPEVARNNNRSSDMPADGNSGLSSPISTVSTKSVWYEYGCV